MVRVLGPHKNLMVWQESMTLSKLVYEATKLFPKSEIHGLIDQMQRSSVSIPSNIAEGYGRGTNLDLIRFLYISLGSSNELDTQIELSYNVGYIECDRYKELKSLNEKVNKMLHSLIQKRQQM